MSPRRAALMLVLCWWALPAHAQGPERYIILLDCSGSVDDAGRARSLRLASRLLADRPGAECALLEFADRIETSLDFGPADRLVGVRPAFTPHRKQTVLYDAIFDASRRLAQRRPARSAMLVFTDGNDVGSDLQPEDSIRICLEKNIPVYAFGIGDRINEKVLRRLSRLSGAAYFHLGQEADIDHALAALQNIGTSLSTAGPTEPAPAKAQQPVSAPPPATKALNETPMAPPPTGHSWVTVASLLVVLLIIATGFVWIRKRRQVQQCPACGTVLDGYLAQCPVCRPPQPGAPEGAFQEVPPSEDAEEPAPLPSSDYPDRKPVSDALDSTVVMLETPVLIVKKGKNLGAVYPVPWRGTINIGRSRSNNIVLEDRTASGKHCRLKHDGEKFLLYDLRSTNGTFLNDHKISQSYVKDGDTMQVGETHLLFKVQRLSA